MIIFISWPVSVDAAFRSAYETLTCESVETHPEINASGDHYLLGSSRVTSLHVESLQNDVSPDIHFADALEALNWVPKAQDL